MIKPIPITEEWLTRFGFESGNGRGRSKNFYYHNSSPFRVEMFEEHILFKEHGNPRELRAIKYAHQLQNLYFALTGEELDYNYPQPVKVKWKTVVGK
jgi:hypothetical protein